MASDISISDFIRNLVSIGVISPDKILAVNTWLNSQYNIVSVSITATSTSNLPDLKITAIECRPESPQVWEAIYCDVSVYNNSAVYIKQPFSVNIQGFLSKIDSLGAYETKTVEAQNPFIFSADGTFPLGFVVDSGHNITESNERNNVFIKNFVIKKSSISK